MNIGMTGTRNGMTEAQAETFLRILKEKETDDNWLHHGDCVGADADAHDLATSIGYQTHIHPPIKTEVRAFKEGTKMCKEDSYFARNRDIVNDSTLLLGFPATPFETKGGTWYTINFAKKFNHNLIIVFPDGTTTKFYQ